VSADRPSPDSAPGPSAGRPQSFEDRRAHPRSPSTGKIRWLAGRGDELPTARLIDISDGGARVLGAAPADLGAEVRFDLLAEDGHVLATGLARIAWIRPAERQVGISFLALGVATTIVASLSPARSATPPPLPASSAAPFIEDDAVDVSTLAEELPDAERVLAPGKFPRRIVVGADFGAGVHVDEMLEVATPEGRMWSSRGLALRVTIDRRGKLSIQARDMRTSRPLAPAQKAAPGSLRGADKD
jgi:hypothetical protein